MANEISELQAIDFGLGRLIVSAFDGLAAVGPADYKEFIARANNKQVFRHDFDAPQDFISAYVGGRKGSRVVTATKSANVLDLPLIAYCRKPGITNNENRGDIIREKIRWDTELENAFMLSVLPVQLTYNLIFLAWDKPTLDKLQLAWYAYISNKKDNHHVFTVSYLIDEKPIEVNAFLQDTKMFNTTDISFTKEEGRVFGVEQTLTVDTQVLFGAPVSVSDLEIQFNLIGWCGGTEVPCCE